MHVRVLVRRDDSLLAGADGGMVTLEIAEPWPWPEVGPVIDGIRDRYGLDVAALRAVGVSTDERTYETAWRRGEPSAGSRWVPASAVPGVPARADGDRQPWYAEGWLDEATEWIEAVLDRHGFRRRAPVRQIRSWGRAALLTVETDRGRLWMKQVSPVHSHEALVTDLLADVDPGVVPPLVDADIAAGRLLLEHVDGPALSDVQDDPAPWYAAMARLAEIQRVLAEDPRAMVVAGVPSADLSSLAAALPGLLADDDLLRPGERGRLTRSEAARLRGRTGDLVAAVERLEADPLPVSLDHGDLAADEVIVGEMGPVVLDWSDATRTHPYLSAAALLDDPVAIASVSLARLEDAYLSVGAGADPDRDARAVMDLARAVRPLHRAWLLAERVLPSLEQPWEMEDLLTSALRPFAAARLELP